MTASDLTRMIAMLTLLRCDGFSVSTLLPKPGTDRGSGDRLVEEGTRTRLGACAIRC